MRNLDFSHLYSNAVGFERMARELEGLFDQKTSAYPPYNIEKRDHDSYLITVAVAGFDRNELELETENGTLKVKGHKWYLGSFYPAYFYSAKIMVSLQKREMTIQLMGFYCNFVQIDNG
jgi:hypothetical protein